MPIAMAQPTSLIYVSFVQHYPLKQNLKKCIHIDESYGLQTLGVVAVHNISERLRLRLRQVYSTQHDIIQMHDIRNT